MIFTLIPLFAYNCNMQHITHEQYFYFLNYFTAVFSQQCDDGKGYCSSDMATVTMSSKHQPLNIYLVFLLFSYISSGNHFHASGAINNNEYCSITKQHTMCSPEVICLFLSIFHIIHFIVLLAIVSFLLHNLNFNIFLLVQGYGPQCGSPKGLSRGVSENEMREILRVHNQWRAKIANGQVTRGRPGPQPPAADMEQMVILNSIYNSAKNNAASFF